jgi:hypothetical protein
MAVAVAILTMECARDDARVRQSNPDWLADPLLNFIVCHRCSPFMCGMIGDDLTRYLSCLLAFIPGSSEFLENSLKCPKTL